MSPSTINDVTDVGARRPLRVVILGLTTGRGPGAVLTTIYDAKNVGFSVILNTAGEFHMTLPNDHPALPFVSERKTHYRVDQLDSEPPETAVWREVTAGLITDRTGLDDETIVYGVDYLGLFQYVIDERFDPDNPNEPPPIGSFYSDTSIGEIVENQLQRAISLVDSTVGFIVVGDIFAMPEKVNIWSIMRATLEFVVALIDSHRQGSGRMTRVSVRNIAGTYTVMVEDDPGVNLPNLRLGYGELVSGYQAIPFGPTWSSLYHGIGREREGVSLSYASETAPTVTTAEFGRWAQSQLWLDIADKNDLIRRTKQAAWEHGRIGQKIGLGLKANALRPLDGYDICDNVPVEIVHGEIDTRDYAAWWCIVSVTCEVFTDGHTDLTFGITPRTPVTETDPDLVTSKPLPPFGGLTGPDGQTSRQGCCHAHAIGEAIIGNGVTTLFYTAQEFEPDTVEAFSGGMRVDVTQGSMYDTVAFAVAPTVEIRLNYLARLV